MAALGGIALVVAACAQERAPVGRPAGAAAGVGSGASPGSGGDGGGAASTGDGPSGAGGAPPPPDVDDCGCLVATREPECRECVEETVAGACSVEAAACDAAEPGYCAIVVDCLARCPVADATCADACLGADDTSRQRVEAFAACACAACAGACGSGDC